MTSSWTATRRLALLLAALAATMLLGASQALAAPGDNEITVPIDDSESGASYSQVFVKAYDGATPTGTKVYVYVPQGSLDASGHGVAAGVQSVDPQFDPDPTDEFVPCATTPDSDHVISQAQISSLGNELANQVVRVDEAHYGPMGGGKALVALVYNIQDESYYDCEETSYTVGYFAPDYLQSIGNVIVLDTYDWANRVGPQTGNADGSPFLMEGVIAHELEHLLMEYSDSSEVSWVDEGLADTAIFLNGYPAGGSHVANQQVFHRETSLTRWGGTLANYGASFSYFLYLWERAGGNGDGTYAPDLDYDDVAGDRLIKEIFREQADSLDGVQRAIDTWNATNGMAADLPSARELFQDWVVTMTLDAEGTKFDLKNFELGSEEASWGWTIDAANDVFFDGRGIYQGAMPEPKWRKENVPAQVAVPFGASYERFRNPGPTFAVDFSGQPAVDIDPPGAATGHWWGGYSNNSDRLLNVTTPVTGGQTIGFDTWYFIEEGWDYGFVEAQVGGQWRTVELRNDAGTVVTTDDNPHENNAEGNGLTGTSGGEYFVDEPEYVHLTGTLPAGTTAVRFRYSTDAGYLDTGWFVSNVIVGGAAATVASAAAPDDWQFVDGQEQDNQWTVQVLAHCDLTPGVTSTGELVDGDIHVYRLTGDTIAQAGFDTKCTKGADKSATTVAISNLPSGALTFFDAPYRFRLTSSGKGS